MERTDFMENALAFQGKAEAVQVLRWSGQRLHFAAEATAAAAQQLPANTKAVEIRATEDCYLAFGATSAIEATADADSVLFLRGVQTIPVPKDASANLLTFVSVIRAGADDGVVQFEKVI